MGFVLNGNILVQSGTDTDLTGLASVAGVTTTVRGGKTLYNMGTLRLTVAGNLSFNSNTEAINWAVGAAAPELTINVGAFLTISGERTVGTATFNTQEVGLIFGRTGTNGFAPAQSWATNNGTFTLDGSGVDANSVIALSGTFIANDALLRNRDLRANFRYQSATHQINGLRAENINTTMINTAPDQLNGLSAFNGAFTFVTLPVNTATTPRIFSELGVSGITPTFTNFGGNSNFIEMENFADWVGTELGMNVDVDFAFRFTKGLQVSYKTLAGADIEDAVIFIPDNDNGNRPSFYPNDEPVIESTDDQGIATAKRLALIANLASNTGTGATPVTPSFDFRNLANNDSGDDVMFIFAYGFNPLRVPVNLKGNGVLEQSITGTVDANVTLDETAARAKLASSFAVDDANQLVTVTGNSTYDDLYDSLVAYKVTATLGNLQSPNINEIDQYIVTPNGINLIAAAGWALIVDAGVTLSEGDKFKRIKFDTVTVNGAITGVFSTTAGTSKIVEITASEGSSIYVGDVSTGITKLFLSNVAAGTYRAFYEPSIVPAVLIARELYGFQRFQEVVTLADGLNVFTPIDIEDIGITEGTLATVEAYTELELPTKFYDRTAAFRLSEQGIKLGQIVTRSGSALEITSFSHVINKDANLVYSIDGSVITTKSISYSADNRYNTEVLVSPFTLTANSDEVLDIAIEDANGDSQISIDGGDGTFELYKVTTATATNDFADGTLIATVGNGIFRFIGEDGFDVIGIDINSNIRRRTSFSKGIYTQAFFVGDQIQLAQAPQVVENGVKLDILQLEINEIKGTGFVSSANSLKAIGVTVTDLGAPLQAADYVEADNASIAAIKAKTDTLVNTDLSAVALEASVQAVKAKTDMLVNTDLTNIALEASVQAVKAKTDTLVNTDLSAVALEATSQEIKTAVNNIDGGGVTLAEIEASTILAKEATSQAIKAKTDTLVNTDLTLVAKEVTSQQIKSKVDTLQNADLSAVALESSVQAVKADISNITVDNEAIALEVWENQPERLKNVATVESTGDQITSI